MTSPEAHLIIIRCYTCRIQWQAVTPHWWKRQGEQVEHPCVTAGHNIRFHKTGVLEVNMEIKTSPIPQPLKGVEQ